MASREKQLKRLRKDALQLWVDQQELLTRANTVARGALPYATEYAKGRVAPALTVVGGVRPTVGRGAALGAAAGKAAASTARDALFGTVVPAVSSVAAAALSLADEAGGRLGVPGDGAKKIVGAIGGVTKQGEKSQQKAALKVAAGAAAAKGAGKAAKGAATAAKASRGGIGLGGTIGILLVLTALAGIGYAIWQTLRADDDLWVADDEPDATSGGDAPTV